MKEMIMGKLQGFSKAMFIPVLILPIAGILIAVGNLFTNGNLINALPFLDNPITKGFGSILSGSLVSILVNLGLIFCVGITAGLAKKKKAEATFTAVLAFLVFINAMNKFMGAIGTLVLDGSLSGTGQTMVLGVQILDMGVFLGIILGLVTAYVHNKYVDTEFNNAFQIYGGPRFVFIVLIPIIVVLAVILTYVWPTVQAGISALGIYINNAGNFGLFLYGALERLLIPTGLHHLIYTPFLYSSLGGVVEVGGQIFEGSRNIYYAEIVDPNVITLSQSVMWDARGISKMFGLLGACLAMYHTARPEKKKLIKMILIPAAVTSFIAGVTEPIEFSFMFVAPILFVVHAGLSGLSMVVLNIFGSRAIGPNGFIDFILLNVPLGIEKTNWPIYIMVGVGFFVLYYVIFRFLITKFNLKTLGRETDDMETKLHSKKDYIAKKENKENSKKEFPVDDLVVGLGGAANILQVDNCYTRLRLVIKDTSRVDELILKNETKASGVIIKGENVQVVYGLNVTKARTALDEYIAKLELN